MNIKKTVLSVVGTRPKAIKMAQVILALKHELWAEVLYKQLFSTSHAGSSIEFC